MSFARVSFGPCKRPLAARTCCVARRASASSSCPLADGRREERRSPRARASGPAKQGPGAVQCRRRYHRWSPPGATDTNSGSGTLLNMAVEKEQQQQQRHQRQPQQQAQTKPPPLLKVPQAVAMEEFADLERKLASPREAPRRKTPEQVMMEEFAALERKLGSTQQASAGAAQPDGQSSRVRNTLTKPEEPEAEECCGNGCATCVWIGYWEELQAWEEAEREREEAPP
ncbi:unnamed protein product [Ectocarpus sp. CCAP 1310/34]|nr:unnamed protein product [Ectocarpus sp. CCAP 1310/34]